MSGRNWLTPHVSEPKKIKLFKVAVTIRTMIYVPCRSKQKAKRYAREAIRRFPNTADLIATTVEEVTPDVGD